MAESHDGINKVCYTSDTLSAADIIATFKLNKCDYIHTFINLDSFFFF